MKKLFQLLFISVLTLGMSSCSTDSTVFEDNDLQQKKICSYIVVDQILIPAEDCPNDPVTGLPDPGCNPFDTYEDGTNFQPYGGDGTCSLPIGALVEFKGKVWKIVSYTGPSTLPPDPGGNPFD